MPNQIRISKNSRYAGTPLYQLRDAVDLPTNSFVFGVWRRINIEPSTNDKIHRLTQGEIGRLDLVAHAHYGDPLLWWVIADVNSINDPFNDIKPGDEIRIPAFDLVRAAMQDANDL